MTEVDWLVLRVVPASREARARLLGHEVARLADRIGVDAWFFCDIPVAREGAQVLGCEVAVGAGVDPLAAAVEDAAASLLRSGIVTDVERVPAPSLLAPRLLPGGRVPPVYAGLLCAASRRSSAIFAGLLRNRRVTPGDDEVAAELVALYTALVPDSERRPVAAMHAAWLEEVAGACTSAPAPSAFSRREPVAGREYLPHATAFDEYVGSFPPPDRLIVRGDVVARLAHIQTVTLRGPDAEDPLVREAALVRALFSGTAAATAPENGA